MPKLKILFADDQLPSRVEADNEITRREIRRELAGRFSPEKLDAAFDEDLQWFGDLLDYLEKTKHVDVVRARSYAEACRYVDDPNTFDVFVVDLSWWGDSTLPAGRQQRHNVGLNLIERIQKSRPPGDPPRPVIALSQNFRDDVELMSTVLDMDALPVPKTYDSVGQRALFSAIQHLARLRPVRAHVAKEPRVRLFISHAHHDTDMAEQLIDVIDRAMEVPDGAIRCTSVPGYKLDLGTMAPEALRQELVGTDAVVALLTPASLASHWVLFELGATWLQAKRVIPLLGSKVPEDCVPGPLRGISAGRLEDASTLFQFLQELMAVLGWPAKNPIAAQSKLMQLAATIRSKPVQGDEIGWELTASFGAKRARIGAKQGEVLDHIAQACRSRSYLTQRELEDRFERKFKESREGLFYRLEQLRYLGFLSRQELHAEPDGSTFGWTLSPKYKSELG